MMFAGFSDVLVEVLFALLPLLLFFLFFQVFFVRLPRVKLYDLIKGLIIAFFGLALFLQGVHVAMIPVGGEIGERLAEMGVLVVLLIGFILGFVATYAEPAVRILNYQVESASSGSISPRILLYAISIAVGLAVAFALARIIYGLSIWWFLVPGYLLALVLIRYSTAKFSAIAFDAGGVATGPMTVTFVFAVCVGLAAALQGRDPLVEGFGLIALVALAPILSVLVFGLVYERASKR